MSANSTIIRLSKSSYLSVGLVIVLVLIIVSAVIAYSDVRGDTRSNRQAIEFNTKTDDARQNELKDDLDEIKGDLSEIKRDVKKLLTRGSTP